MKRPICDFVKEYTESATVRAHMPGHKGKGDIERYDITEIAGADSLFDAEGIIRESEEYASGLFGAKTFYSTEGSSHTIRAMLYLVSLYAKKQGKEPRILAARNAHKALLSALIMLDIEVEWIFPNVEDSYLSMKVCPEDLDMILSVTEEKPTAVYITSPDYLGAVSDIAGLSAVCREHGVLLIIDNAHGAYLRFLPENAHPITLGADMCCDSAHKTLPVLTGGAYLHINREADPIFTDTARHALALFGSTSPSYIVLQSLDAVNGYLDGNYRAELAGFLPKAEALKTKLAERGYSLFGDEPMKITIKASEYGYSGDELADILRERDIECEFSDRDHLVLMLTPQNTDGELEIIEKALLSIEKKDTKAAEGLITPTFCLPMYEMSPREAALSPSEMLPLDECIGRVCALATVGCPPAVPIVVSGEVIDETAAETLRYYGVTECLVVKKSK